MALSTVFPRVLFSQADNHWRTPPEIYKALDAEFGFTLDPCPAEPAFDGLAISWRGQRVFCNPPYRRGEIEKWMAKAREATLAVFLVPVRTTPRWWHDYALLADEIRFFRQRLRFSGSRTNAPFDSCAVIFGSACRSGRTAPLTEMTGNVPTKDYLAAHTRIGPTGA